MHSKTSLDEKLSDLVGATTYELSENIDLKYNFSMIKVIVILIQ